VNLGDSKLKHAQAHHQPTELQYRLLLSKEDCLLESRANTLEPPFAMETTLLIGYSRRTALPSYTGTALGEPGEKLWSRLKKGRNLRRPPKKKMKQRRRKYSQSSEKLQIKHEKSNSN
jgi:hypothetical protein